jgi:hypothetical protein
MPYEKLLSAFDAAIAARNMSERKALLTADVGVKMLYHMRARGHAPKPEKVAKLAAFLNLRVEEMLALAAAEQPNAPDLGRRERIFVKGVVQAGAWQGEVVWPEQDWYSVDTPADPRYPGIPRFGLLVRGDSMNLIFPEGSVVIAIRFFDLARAPRSGEKVVVLRRSSTGDFEATLKEYQVDSQGRHILWPRSSDPAFQNPIILPHANLPMSDGESDGQVVAYNYALPEAGVEDLVIDSLVVGHYGLI